MDFKKIKYSKWNIIAYSLIFVSIAAIIINLIAGIYLSVLNSIISLLVGLYMKISRIEIIVKYPETKTETLQLFQINDIKFVGASIEEAELYSEIEQNSAPVEFLENVSKFS